jgi:mono/diheme cytochrome c family protein
MAMKFLKPALVTILATLTLPALAGGDPVAGKQKAVGCVACHGNDTFGGIFFSPATGRP